MREFSPSRGGSRGRSSQIDDQIPALLRPWPMSGRIFGMKQKNAHAVLRPSSDVGRNLHRSRFLRVTCLHRNLLKVEDLSADHRIAAFEASLLNRANGGLVGSSAENPRPRS